MSTITATTWAETCHANSFSHDVHYRSTSSKASWPLGPATTSAYSLPQLKMKNSSATSLKKSSRLKNRGTILKPLPVYSCLGHHSKKSQPEQALADASLDVARGVRGCAHAPIKRNISQQWQPRLAGMLAVSICKEGQLSEIRHGQQNVHTQHVALPSLSDKCSTSSQDWCRAQGRNSSSSTASSTAAPSSPFSTCSSTSFSEDEPQYRWHSCHDRDSSEDAMAANKTFDDQELLNAHHADALQCQFRLCRIDGCGRYAQKAGICITHGARRSRCKVDGCGKGAVRGGICKAHGAKMKTCIIVNCTRQAVRGGLCISHGAQVKRCSVEGCDKHSQRGGVCVAHGAKVKRCSAEGCGKYAVRGGVCVSHGAKVNYKRCSQSGCTRMAQRGGVCVGHSKAKELCDALLTSLSLHTSLSKEEIRHQQELLLEEMRKKKVCRVPTCEGEVFRGGYCFDHRSKIAARICRTPGCHKFAVRDGVCVTHGAQVRAKSCRMEGCNSPIVFKSGGGLCKEHGSTVKRKRCGVEGCTRFAKHIGFCILHNMRR